MRALHEELGAYISEREIIDRQMLGLEYQQWLDAVSHHGAAEFRPHPLGRRLRMHHVTSAGEHG